MKADASKIVLEFWLNGWQKNPQGIDELNIIYKFLVQLYFAHASNYFTLISYVYRLSDHYVL